MSRLQLEADTAESRPDKRPPDDWRHVGGQLRHTTGKERQHRDRGTASDSQSWREHVRADKD